MPHAFRNLSASLAIATYESLKSGFEFTKRKIFILLAFAAFFDYRLSLAYKRIRMANRLDFDQFRLHQTLKSQNDFFILLNDIKANRGVILRHFDASAPYPLDQLLFRGIK